MSFFPSSSLHSSVVLVNIVFTYESKQEHSLIQREEGDRNLSEG